MKHLLLLILIDTLFKCLFFFLKSDNILEKLIIDSKMFEFIKEPVAYQNKIKEATSTLKYIRSKIPDSLINVFRMDSEEGSSDIELTILRAFLNCKLKFNDE